jgi:hypothetical protein
MAKTKTASGDATRTKLSQLMRATLQMRKLIMTGPTSLIVLVVFQHRGNPVRR